MNLAEPSKELAKNLLRKVDFESRLTAVKMTAMAGNKREPIYGFNELVDFLEEGNIKEFDPSDTKKQQKNFGQYLAFVDPGELHSWMEERGDQELSNRIKLETKRNSNYKAKMESILPLLRERLDQSKRVLKGEGGYEQS